MEIGMESHTELQAIAPGGWERSRIRPVKPIVCGTQSVGLSEDHTTFLYLIIISFISVFTVLIADLRIYFSCSKH